MSIIAHIPMPTALYTHTHTGMPPPTPLPTCTHILTLAVLYLMSVVVDRVSRQAGWKCSPQLAILHLNTVWPATPEAPHTLHCTWPCWQVGQYQSALSGSPGLGRSSGSRQPGWKERRQPPSHTTSGPLSWHRAQ